MHSGMQIKIFENTDVQSYVDLVNKKGYHCEVHSDRIIVGKSKRTKYDAVEMGKQLKLARCRAKLTRKDIASRVWTNPTMVGTWERGKHVPSEDYLRRFCKAVGLDMERLKKETALD